MKNQRTQNGADSFDCYPTQQ
jgi:hypothetical protein